MVKNNYIENKIAKFSDTDNLKVFKPKIAFKAMLVTEHFSHVSFILNFFILFEFW